MADFDDLHDRLVAAVRAANLEGVRAIIFGLAGTGVCCQRLALLDHRARNGMTAEDVAVGLADGSDTRAAIVDLLRSERMRMEFYE